MTPCFLASNHRSSLLLIALLLTVGLTAQHGFVRDIPLAERVSRAAVVVEAEVISERSFWDADHSAIYTAYTLRPFSTFKGETPDEFELVKRGGFIGLEGMLEYPSMGIAVGDIGVYLIEATSIEEDDGRPASLKMYKGVSGPLSAIYRDRVTGGYFDLDDNLGQNINDLLYSLTGETSISHRDRPQALLEATSSQMPIISFSPMTITAGTLSELTILGSGFGTTPGNVFFADPDNGGAGFVNIPPHGIISWSETEVVVQVPSRAGSGNVFLQTAAGENMLSVEELDIPYSQTTVTSDFTGSFKNYSVRHADVDDNGGYFWRFNTAFAANTAASEAFTRAMETWSCTSGVNWEVGANTTLDQIANDGVNIVRFDNGTETGSALGITTSRYSGCGNGAGDLDWYVSEMDIVMNTEVNWNFGPQLPTGSQSDFESVVLHELGHAHQISHVIEPGNLMHWLLQSGNDNRLPEFENTEAAIDILSRGTSGGICAQSALDPIDCSEPCLGDLNGDLQVSIEDFLIFSSAFGMECSCSSDINGTGTVTIEDFLIFSSAFGSSCE